MTSVISTTGSQTTLTNDTLLALQQQTIANRVGDQTPIPTTINGEETIFVEGQVVTNYTGGNRNILRNIKKLMNRKKMMNENMKKINRNKNKIKKMKKMLNRNVKNKENKKRVFQLVDYPKEGQLYGHYTGTHPKQAANKVLTFLAKKINLKNTNHNNQIVFWIVDKDSGKKKCYTGTRIKLMRPNIVKRGNRNIKYWHKNTLIDCKHQGVNMMHPNSNNKNNNNKKSNNNKKNNNRKKKK